MKSSLFVFVLSVFCSFGYADALVSAEKLANALEALDEVVHEVEGADHVNEVIHEAEADVLHLLDLMDKGAPEHVQFQQLQHIRHHMLQLREEMRFHHYFHCPDVQDAFWFAWRAFRNLQHEYHWKG